MMGVLPGQEDTKVNILMGHPLIIAYNAGLSRNIGVLSEFIVNKQVSSVIISGNKNLDHERAISLIDSIMENVELLVGRNQAEELEEEFRAITEEYFKENEENEQ